MDIITEVLIPTPPSSNLGFYEHSVPTCVLSSTELAQSTNIVLGMYEDLSWSAGTADPGISEASFWGTKALPGAGAFYFANHEDGNPTLGHLEPDV